LSAVTVKATLERSLAQLATDADSDSQQGMFENETLVMALGLLGALVTDKEQVFHHNKCIDSVDGYFAPVEML